MKKIKTAALSACLLAAGCSDSGNSGGGSAGGGNAGGGTNAPAKLVVNEIQAYQPEWVEVANPGATDLDVSGMGLCDEDINGDCELAVAMRFPEGTTIPANGYVVILTNQLAADGVGPHTACGLAGVDECFFASWRIGAVDGETIRAIDADDSELSALLYPPSATADTTTSWSRLPDLVGDRKSVV